MKKLALLACSSALFLSGCVAPEPAPAPAPVVIEQHHYHTNTRRIYVPTKSAPSGGSSSSAEGFRAIEQPGTYSQ